MPPKHRDIHLSGIDIHRKAEAPRRLRRDDGAAAAAERLVDGIVRRTVVQHRVAHVLHRLLRAMDGGRVPLPRSKVVGGSDSINGYLYVRGEAAADDMWAQLGCRGWLCDDLLPFFKLAEIRGNGSRNPRVGLAGHHAPWTAS